MLKPKNQLKPRDLYLNRLIAFQDTEPVKVVTGIRRCGKSSLLRLMQMHLIESGIPEAQLVSMNFESMEYRDLDVTAFYDHVKAQVIPGKRMYLFFDELQRLEGWQDAVNSFRVDFDCDIYITGSNAYLLSGEYATYLAGRYVEIKMLPLSFAEFVRFHGYIVRDGSDPSGKPKKRAYDPNGEAVTWDELFEAYLHYGGMPGLADVGLSQDKALALLDSLYSTVAIRDILDREKHRGIRQPGDPTLLKKIVMYLADNIGNPTSFNAISNTLVSENMLSDRSRQGKPAVQTVAAYVNALIEAYLFYEIKRFDIKGKSELKTLGKYYIVDTGLRNCLLGYRDTDYGHIIENVVFFELLRRGYDVAVGKIGDKEIDFIATRDERKYYCQVTYDLSGEDTLQRELAPLRAVRDNYEKLLICFRASLTKSIDGIRLVSLYDFLLEDC